MQWYTFICMRKEKLVKTLTTVNGGQKKFVSYAMHFLSLKICCFTLLTILSISLSLLEGSHTRKSYGLMMS